MHNTLAVTLIFAILMLTMPLLALSNKHGDVQFIKPDNSLSESRPAAKTAASSREREEEVEATSDGESGADAEFEAEQDKAEPVDERGMTTVQAGDGFTVLDRSTGKIMKVSTRDFVRGALAAEMPPTFHPEALKAQAVAAHTYALNVKAAGEVSPNAEYKGVELSADPKNWKSYVTEKLFFERYGELATAYWKTICEAADEVSGYAVVYEDEPIVAAYCSMSNGTTEDAANVWLTGLPYLVPVDSFGDTLAPDYATTETFTAAEVADALKGAYPDIELSDDPTVWLSGEEYSASGYVTSIKAGDQTLSGAELRSLLGLRSTDFTSGCNGDTFTFEVNGYGHGVGLSQYGADYMARQGSSFDQILQHYYPGTTLGVVVEG